MNAIRRKYRADDLSRAAAAMLSASVTAATSHAAVAPVPKPDATVVLFETDPLARFAGVNATASAEFVFRVAPERWSKQLERQFVALAKKAATEQITEDERTDFERLRHWRRQLRCPLSADEVEFQLKKRCLERKVREALQAYVDFTKWQNSPRSRT